MKKISTKKANNRTIICLSGYIDTDYFYNEFMDELYEYQYKDDSWRMKIPPILSFENVDVIESDVLPCFTAVGIIMKSYYNEPCQLLFNYGLSGLPLLQFLTTTKFLYLVKNKLNIYDYDEDKVGGFSLLEKPYNPDYTIEFFTHIEDFYEKSIEQQNGIKYQIQDDLIVYDVPRIFGGVLKKVLDENTQEYDMCIRCVAEIIANAELYSLSDSFVAVQARKSFVRISLCDVGIGFTKSLELKHTFSEKGTSIENLMRKFGQKNNISQSVVKDLQYFFMALKEAEDSALDNDSNNLYRLIEIITSKKGFVKIHFNKVRVTFDKKLFDIYKANQDAFIELLLENYISEKKGLDIYKANINGVHIEIRIEIDDTKGDRYAHR